MLQYFSRYLFCLYLYLGKWNLIWTPTIRVRQWALHCMCSVFFSLFCWVIFLVIFIFIFTLSCCSIIWKTTKPTQSKEQANTGRKVKMFTFSLFACSRRKIFFIENVLFFREKEAECEWTKRPTNNNNAINCITMCHVKHCDNNCVFLILIHCQRRCRCSRCSRRRGCCCCYCCRTFFYYYYYLLLL